MTKLFFSGHEGIEKCWDDGWIWNPETKRYDRILRLEEGGIGSRIRIQPSVYQPDQEEK